MLWRGVDITTFPTKQLWEWVDRLEKEKLSIIVEIDRRTVELIGGSTQRAVEAAGRPTDRRPFQRVGSPDRPIDPGAPPPTDGDEG